MKNRVFAGLALAVIIASIPLTTLAATDASSALLERTSGHILLQTEAHGEAWYINPGDGKRYYVKDGATAFEVLRRFGLGITATNLARIPVATSTSQIKLSGSFCFINDFAKGLRGKVLLQAQENGEAWYVDADTCLRIYLKDGVAAYDVMHFLGLGARNIDISGIPLGTLNLPPVATSELKDAKVALGFNLPIASTTEPVPTAVDLKKIMIDRIVKECGIPVPDYSVDAWQWINQNDNCGKPDPNIDSATSQRANEDARIQTEIRNMQRETVRVQGGLGCNANYSGCVPIASDVDCEGGGGDGPQYVRGPVMVIGRDEYDLDRDGDGLGCESN